MKFDTSTFTLNLFIASLIMAALIGSPKAHAQLSITSTANLIYTGGEPDVFNLDGKQCTMEIVWAPGTTWTTLSNLMQAISESITFTIDGQPVVFPATNELPLIFNIVNSVSDLQAYSDINENTIINFTYLGVDSRTQSLIHPDAPPIEVANGDPLLRCHLETGFALLNDDGFFRELLIGGSTYAYTNVSETITGGTALKGDVNQDCEVNLLDVEPFIDLLNSGTYRDEADINEDGFVNLLDIESFVDLINN